MGELNLILTWPAYCVASSSTAANQAAAFAVCNTKRYAPVVTLSTNDNQFQYKLSNSQLNKLKSRKNGTVVTLNLSSNVIGDSSEESDFPHY